MKLKDHNEFCKKIQSELFKTINQKGLTLRDQLGIISMLEHFILEHFICDDYWDKLK